jgi:hypothetical protein
LSYCEQRKHCQPSGAVEFVTFRLLIWIHDARWKHRRWMVR